MNRRITIISLLLSLAATAGITLDLPNEMSSAPEQAPAAADSTAHGDIMPQAMIITEEETVAAPVVNHDSIEAAITDSLVNLVSDTYKNIKLKRSYETESSEYYPQIYSCYSMAMNVLPRLKANTQNYNTIRGVLYDIDGLLLPGAYYYSAQKQQAELNKFARAVIDIQLLDIMKDMDFKNDNESFAQICYIAASDAYNNQEFDKAIEYFKKYFTTGSQMKLENVYTFMSQACINTGDYRQAITTLAEGMKNFPSNTFIPLLGVEACVKGKGRGYLQPFLERALAATPEDTRLLDIQGKLYEDEMEYRKALEIYSKIDHLTPNKLDVAKHLAFNYYNQAVQNFNNAVNAENEKAANKSRTLSKTYFNSAALKFEEVLASDPMDSQSLKSLGVSYLCLEEKDKFDEINRRLMALGKDALSNVFIPPHASVSGGQNIGDTISGGKSLVVNDIPSYSDYGTPRIKEGLEKWVKKGEFETPAKYQERVNEQTIKAEHDRIALQVQREYLDTYSKQMHLSDIKLRPYDADNETFLIDTSYGPVTLKVPLKDNEAERFKSEFQNMRLRNPQYEIENDKVVISSLTFMSPSGKTYKYDKSRKTDYTQTVINLDLAAIISSVATSAKQDENVDNTVATKDIKITVQSDVDKDIPADTRKRANANTFALIIANENYENVPNVSCATHDGETFAKYCKTTLGIPEENVRYINNATLGRIKGELKLLDNIVKAVGSEAEVIFYYAGHGIPCYETRDALLMPVDGVASLPDTSYPLTDLYAKLEDMNAGAVMVFMDACFSGASRDGGMIEKARGVEIETTEATPRGSMYILSAASGQETAHPYKEKNHGLFTYYLLKKIQETAGNVTLKELGESVIRNVQRQSNIVNKKPQTPQMRTFGNMTDKYQNKKLRR